MLAANGASVAHHARGLHQAGSGSTRAGRSAPVQGGGRSADHSRERVGHAVPRGPWPGACRGTRSGSAPLSRFAAAGAGLGAHHAAHYARHHLAARGAVAKLRYQAAAAKLADLVLLPCRPSVLDVEAIADTAARVRADTAALVVAVLNACAPRGQDADQVAAVPAYTTRVLPAPAAGVAQDSTVPRSFRYSSRAVVPGTLGMSADPPGTPGSPAPDRRRSSRPPAARGAHHVCCRPLKL